MAYLDEHKAKFDNLRVSLDLQHRDQLKRKANGGNTILFIYPPKEEQAYLQKSKELFSSDKFKFIDITALLVDYINEDGWEDFKEFYNEFKDTPHKVFRSNDEEVDLLQLIIDEITSANNSNLTPILIRTGALYGTGIDNVNIMEHKTVMTLKEPLVIFYPGKVEGDSLLFLNFKPASKYRCTIIN